MSRFFVRAEVKVPAVAGLSLCGRELSQLTENIMESMGFDDSGVDVRLSGDQEVAQLNARFRDLPGPTNVLSFPDEALDQYPDSEIHELGQVVVNRDAVLREARLYGQDPLEHLVRLLAHGLLHLAGEEHGQDMEERTDRAVAEVVPTLYI